MMHGRKNIRKFLLPWLQQPQLNEVFLRSEETRPTYLLQGKTFGQRSVLPLEKALFAEYKRDPKFYDVFIEKFIAMYRGVEIHSK